MDFLEYAESGATAKTSKFTGLGRKKIAIGALVVIALCLMGFMFFTFNASAKVEVAKSGEGEASALTQSDLSGSDSASSTSVKICVDVAGAVWTPGVVYLDSGSRVADAIAAAGGAREDAAMSQINQARALVDGEQIYVSTQTEIDAQAATAATAQSTDASDNSVASAANSGKININTATAAELQTISGIGESKAQKIIAYRTSNGNFKTVDDLVNVSGIGEKTLESIRDLICV